MVIGYEVAEELKLNQAKKKLKSNVSLEQKQDLKKYVLLPLAKYALSGHRDQLLE